MEELSFAEEASIFAIIVSDLMMVQSEKRMRSCRFIIDATLQQKDQSRMAAAALRGRPPYLDASPEKHEHEESIRVYSVPSSGKAYLLNSLFGTELPHRVTEIVSLPFEVTPRWRSTKSCSLKTSSEGGFDIEIGSYPIYVPKYSSVYHPIIEMVLFAQAMCYGTLTWLEFSASKKIVELNKSKLVITKPKSYSPNTASAPKYVHTHADIAQENHSVTPGLDKNTPKLGEVDYNVDLSTVPVHSGGLPQENVYNLHSLTRAQVIVGWPPVRNYRKNTLAAHATKTKAEDHGKSEEGCCYVKVSMDGAPYPRKVDLKTYSSYDNLSLELEKMFSCFITGKNSSCKASTGDRLTGSGLDALQDQECVLTYEDKDADRMLVGDLPWDAPNSAEHGIANPEGKEEVWRLANTWLMATAALHHATGNRDLLSGFTIIEDLFVKAGDGVSMPVCGRGSVITGTMVLPDVWFVPGLTENLVSAAQLTELDYSIGFARGACIVKSATDGAVIGKARASEDGLFEVEFLKVWPVNSSE